MLQSPTAKLSEENQHGLNLLQLKMQQSKDALEHIQRLLNITTPATISESELVQDTSLQLEQECGRMKIELLDTNQALQKKTDLLDKTQNQVQELSKSLETLSVKYDNDMETWNKKYSDAKEDLEGLNRDYNELSRKKSDLEDTVHQIKELNQSEFKKKDLLLRESVQEQKLLTQNVLERDGEIEALKDTINQLKIVLDEKIEEINHKQNIEEEYQILQDKMAKLEDQNTRNKKRLENLNELYQHKQLQEYEHEIGETTSNPSNGINNSNDDILGAETEWIQTNSVDNNIQLKLHNSSKSRIPVLSGSMSKSASHVTTEQMNMMKEDLLLYQEKLVEKISQNRELENAMERMNEHCTLLRNSLNITREESADRYRKMMKYMEENRKLREMLDELSSR